METKGRCRPHPVHRHRYNRQSAGQQRTFRDLELLLPDRLGGHPASPVGGLGSPLSNVLG